MKEGQFKEDTDSTKQSEAISGGERGTRAWAAVL